jgi:hypothetical protein
VLEYCLWVYMRIQTETFIEIAPQTDEWTNRTSKRCPTYVCTARCVRKSLVTAVEKIVDAATNYRGREILVYAIQLCLITEKIEHVSRMQHYMSWANKVGCEQAFAPGICLTRSYRLPQNIPRQRTINVRVDSARLKM